jgi:hypothetical protein
MAKHPTLGAGLSASPFGSGYLEWDFCVLFGVYTSPKRPLFRQKGAVYLRTRAL